MLKDLRANNVRGFSLFALYDQTRRHVAADVDADCSVGMRLCLDERGSWRAAVVCPGGPANLAGLRAGDIIATVDFRLLEVRSIVLTQSRRMFASSPLDARCAHPRGVQHMRSGTVASRGDGQERRRKRARFQAPEYNPPTSSRGSRLRRRATPRRRE